MRPAFFSSPSPSCPTLLLSYPTASCHARPDWASFVSKSENRELFHIYPLTNLTVSWRIQLRRPSSRQNHYSMKNLEAPRIKYISHKAKGAYANILLELPNCGRALGPDAYAAPSLRLSQHSRKNHRAGRACGPPFSSLQNPSGCKIVCRFCKILKINRIFYKKNTNPGARAKLFPHIFAFSAQLLTFFIH